MIWKITLKKPIQFESREIVYLQINYIGLFKRCLFVIMVIYLVVVYMVLDNNIFKIAILTNSTKKHFELNKNIQLGTIYKYIDTTYIMIDIIKAFVVVTTAFFIFSDLFSTIQKKIIFNNRYQNVNFIIQPFEKGIELPVFGTEFIFISEIETMFIVKSSVYSPFLKIDFSINVVF